VKLIDSLTRAYPQSLFGAGRAGTSFGAIATEKGNVLFFDDIHRQDERLEKALEAKRVRS
jgi:hypothetical protein